MFSIGSLFANIKEIPNIKINKLTKGRDENSEEIENLLKEVNELIKEAENFDGLNNRI